MQCNKKASDYSLAFFCLASLKKLPITAVEKFLVVDQQRFGSRRPLSNVFLHYVLDVWFETEVKPRLGGDAFLIRFADDFAIGFRFEVDARLSLIHI